MGLTFDQLFPGRFIKAGEMHGKPVTLTIERIYLEELEKEDGTTKPQAIVIFREIKREWALNRTNASALRAMWGDDTDAWLGKRVTLFPEPDTSGLSESGVAIRVKGSPDIAKTITAQIKLPRRRPVQRKLEKTTAGKHDQDAFADDAPPADVDPETGEVNDERLADDFLAGFGDEDAGETEEQESLL